MKQNQKKKHEYLIGIQQSITIPYNKSTFLLFLKKITLFSIPKVTKQIFFRKKYKKFDLIFMFRLVKEREQPPVYTLFFQLNKRMMLNRFKRETDARIRVRLSQTE